MVTQVLEEDNDGIVQPALLYSLYYIPSLFLYSSVGRTTRALP